MIASDDALLLIGESFSPWSKKARWALEHRGLAYAYEEYVPTLSEPRLRWRLRQWSGSVSVPVLFAGERPIRGSWNIACFANDLVDGSDAWDMTRVARWDTLSEVALAEGRTRVVRSVLANDRALEEALPPFVPQRLRRPLRFVARDAARRLDRKYAHLLDAGALRRALLATRDALARTSSDYLLDTFSYADMTMAVVLEVIAPIANVDPPLGPETARCWHDDALAREFADLVQWRDRLAADVRTTCSQFRTGR